ncbi:unnamed protein product, partial [Allacma fusca]
ADVSDDEDEVVEKRDALEAEDDSEEGASQEADVGDEEDEVVEKRDALEAEDDSEEGASEEEG